MGTLNTLSGTFNDEISSVRLFGDARVKLCRNTNLNGACRTYFNSRANLHGNINNQASSLRVFVAPPGPVTFSTGPINLQQTFSADLDTGNVGGAGSDIWYQAVSPVEKYLTPRPGAAISFSGGAQRGYAGCSTASYTTNRLPLWTVPIGSYVCVKTNQGRYSEFRLNGFTGTTMILGYTTWAN